MDEHNATLIKNNVLELFGNCNLQFGFAVNVLYSIENHIIRTEHNAMNTDIVNMNKIMNNIFEYPCL